jgi:hypothetical protein
MEKNQVTKNKIENIRLLFSIFTTSGFKNAISCGVDPLRLSANEEPDIAYCGCECAKGISSDVERETARCTLVLRLVGGGRFNIVSVGFAIF